MPLFLNSPSDPLHWRLLFNKTLKFFEFSRQKMLEMYTVATDELLCLKNAGTQISMFFYSNRLLSPIAIEKIINKPGGRFGANQLNSTAN